MEENWALAQTLGSGAYAVSREPGPPQSNTAVTLRGYSPRSVREPGIDGETVAELNRTGMHDPDALPTRTRNGDPSGTPPALTSRRIPPR